MDGQLLANLADLQRVLLERLDEPAGGKFQTVLLDLAEVADVRDSRAHFIATALADQHGLGPKPDVDLVTGHELCTAWRAEESGVGLDLNLAVIAVDDLAGQPVCFANEVRHEPVGRLAVNAARITDL